MRIANNINTFGMIVRDEPMHYILASSMQDNLNSLDSLSNPQLFASACRGFDSDSKSWISCGIFLDLALIKDLSSLR